MRFFYSIIIISSLLISCQNKEIDIANFDPFTNFNSSTSDSVLRLTIDLDNAISNGIEIPTTKQTKNGFFNVKFNINRNTDEEVFYKIYYQNESYKMAENSPLAIENFYGSWDNNIRFKKIENSKKEIRDSFRIIGNPRNESLYFVKEKPKVSITEEQLNKKITSIRNNNDWFKDVQQKAEKENRSVEDQLKLDAEWSIKELDTKEEMVNHRWKRNPRVGNYKVMLVACTESDLKKIPNAVQNISQKDSIGKFINPFSYFSDSLTLTKLPNTIIVTAKKQLKVTVNHNLASGIFINQKNFNGLDPNSIDTSYYSSSCGESDSLSKIAQFEQYFHWVNKDYTVYNVPEYKDITNGDFSRKEYDSLMKKYKDDPKELVKMFVNTTDCPCKTVKFDSTEKSLVLTTPGGSFKKEHVGIRSRIGFSYGKWRAKIKFPSLLSKDHVWNGLTNAFWLLSQNEENWNVRRECDADIAYIPKPEGDNEAALHKSKKQIAYSEIDFEIVKESQYWPQTSYKTKKYPQDDAMNNHDVMVCCTNWDMACHQPKNFDIGAKKYTVNDKTYELHRWNHWYKALTSKIPVNNDELFGGNYFYYEIDWQPERIIWRIGKEKNNMRVIMTMDQNVSSIPNNQMTAIVTQEWHNQEWWPTAPFLQNFIPFPKNDIKGKILELEIE